MTPQEARIITDFLIADFEREFPTTMKVIEAAPQGKLDHAPDAKAMSALKLIRHLVVIDGWFLNSIADGAFVGGTTEAAENAIHIPGDGAAKYQTTVPEALARIKALPDEKLAQDIDFFGMMQLPAPSALALALKHSIHHRGQLSTYLRSMGGKVPGIYGPSGDSEPMA